MTAYEAVGLRGLSVQQLRIFAVSLSHSSHELRKLCASSRSRTRRGNVQFASTLLVFILESPLLGKHKHTRTHAQVCAKARVNFSLAPKLAGSGYTAAVR